MVLSSSSLTSDGVGSNLFVSVILSVSGAQVLLDTVQVKTVLEPAVTPVTVVVNELILLIVPGPETLLHTPVPIAGMAAVTVNVLLSHCSITAGPASAVLGGS